jgi:hypothetical protein
MAMNKKTLKLESNPKNTRQGQGRNTKYAATSRNTAKKKYRGQGS